MTSEISVSTRAVRAAQPDRVDARGDVCHPAVVEIVAGDHREHHVVESHPVDGLRHPRRLVGVGRHRLAGVDEAEPARPGAAVAEHHERGGAVGPALGQVRTAGVLAHGDEIELAERAAERQHLRAVLHHRPQPLGLAALDRQTGDHARVGEARHQADRLTRPLASREPAEVVGTVPPRDVLALAATARPTRRGEPGDDVDDALDRHVDALLGERRHGSVADAARHDVLAHVRQIGGDVERETVHRAAAGQANADRRDLARVRPFGVDPHAGILGEATDAAQAELAQRIDEQLLDSVDVVGRTERVVDRQDRIADELTRPVIRDVAAPLDGDEVGADRGRVAQQVGGQIGPRDRT